MNVRTGVQYAGYARIAQNKGLLVCVAEVKPNRGGRPRKSVEQHIADGTLRLARHKHLALNVPRCQCKQCGQNIFGRKRRFCDELCRKASEQAPRLLARESLQQLQSCSVCDQEFLPNHPSQYVCESVDCKKERRRRKEAERFPYSYKCSVCGESYRTKVKAFDKCCGECRGKYSAKVRNERRKTEQGWHAISDGCHRWLLKSKSRLNPCKMCGEYAQRKFCSRECQVAWNRILCGAAFCRQCGSECRKHKWYCRRCALERRIASDRRNRSKTSDNHEDRARRYGVPFEKVNPRKVFARDGWRCKCCGIRVTKAGPVWHNMRAELGHVIAMAKGGGHIYSNVQCECRRCNAIKGDTLSDPRDSLAWNTLTMVPHKHRTYVLIQHTLATHAPPARGGSI